jgi:hypothetical protein
MDSDLIGTWQRTLEIRDLNDQLATYRHQWQSDQQKQMTIKMVGKLPGKSSDSKRKINERNNHNSGGSRSSRCQGNNGRVGRGRGGRRERRGRGGHNNDNNEHLKNVVCNNCDKKGHYLTDCRAPKKKWK